MPLITVLIAVLLDTALIPVFYHGTYVVPITFVVVMCISLVRGRLFGLLYGMIGGLIIDISTGTLGIMTFFLMSTGFLIGVIIVEGPSARPAWQLWLRRAVISLAMYMIGEIVFLVYRYFVTNSIEWIYVFHALVRGLIVGLLTMLFFVPLSRIYGGITAAPSAREVKRF